MRNGKPSYDSVYLGPGAAGSWDMDANCCSVTDPTPSQAQPILGPKTVTDRLTPPSRSWHRQAGFIEHTEAKHWGKIILTSGQMRRFGSSGTSFPLQKKETKKMPFPNFTLFAWQVSFFFSEKQASMVACLNKKAGTKKIMWWNWHPVAKQPQAAGYFYQSLHS